MRAGEPILHGVRRGASAEVDEERGELRMRRLYREDKPKFYTIVMAFWVALGTFGIFRGWSTLSLVMCASMAASAFLFIGTSKKDAAWIAEHGDPDEYEKKMKQLEKEAALRAAQEAEAAEVAPEFAEMPERPFVDAEGEIEEAVDADFEVEK